MANISINNDKAKAEEEALFKIFASFMWREVDVVEDYETPEIDFDAPADDFVIDLDPSVTYRTSTNSLRNKVLMTELNNVASLYGLKVALDLPNDDLIYDIIPNLVDIEVRKDNAGSWRIQPSFTLR